MEEVDQRYLNPTDIIDSDHEEVLRFAEETVGKTQDPVVQAVKLYYAVRDGIWYDPYSPFYRPGHYRASNVLKRGRGYCVSKASLLCALGRACGIPTRVGFADVRNHLATKQLLDFLGTDLFVYHGFSELYLNGEWIKATPAFNIELCRRHNVDPLEFNGREDSLFHPYNNEKKRFMEYVTYHDTYPDIPVDVILSVWERTYGKDRVKGWIEAHEKAAGKPISDFYREDIWEG